MKKPSDEEKEKVERALGRSDPFDFWLKEARHHCVQLGLSDRPVVEALSIVKNAFGEAWLREQLSKTKIVMPHPQRHPLVGWIQIPGKHQVCSVLEISNYLKAMCHVPNFLKVIEMMRSDRQFESAFNQLAFGYRFMSVGAQVIEFEPDTDGGRNSDILFKFHDQTFIAESFVSERREGLWYSDLLNVSADRARFEAEKKSKRITVFLTVRNELSWTPKARKDLEQHIAKLIDLAVPGKATSKKEEHFEVWVHDTTELSATEEKALFEKLYSLSTCGVNFGLVPVASTLEIMRGKEIASTPVGRFLIKVEEEAPSLDELVDKLATKMEQKISQLRKASVDAKGILLVGTHHGGPDHESKMPNLLRVKRKIVDGHENVVAAFMVKRVQNVDAVPFYSGSLIGGDGDAVSEELFRSLIAQEWKRDFLIR